MEIWGIGGRPGQDLDRQTDRIWILGEYLPNLVKKESRSPR
jgi:hypothetical protein